MAEKANKLSPMMQQYFQIKSEYPVSYTHLTLPTT